MNLRRALGAASVSAALVVGMAAPVVAHPGHDYHGPPAGPGAAPPGTALDTPLKLTRIGHVNPGPGATGDVYGHRGHAYLASWVGNNCMSNGVRVYNLADPTAPRHVSTFADKASEPDLVGTWTEKVIVQRVHTRKFRGDLAVVTFQTCNREDNVSFRGFALYDVTKPARPRPLGRYAAPGTRGSHEIWLGAHGGRAYVYTAIIRSELTTGAGFDPATGRATAPGRADFRIVDVANPRRPRDVGEWGAWRKLGVQPWDGANFVHSVIVDKRLKRAILSYWDLGTVILDIRRPHRPRLLGRTTPTQGATHSANLAKGGRVLVETHETEAGLPVFYDISNPRKPRQIGVLEVENAAKTTVHDPKVRGGRTYFSWYDLGVVVADTRRPDRPRLLAQFVSDDLTPNPDFCDEQGCSQTWGVFVLGRNVLASDMNSGLYVLRLNR